MYSFSKILKQAHLYLFLFMLCELAYGGIQFNPVLVLVRKVVLVLGLTYTLFYFGKIPTYLRVLLAVMACLLLHLTGEALTRYGVWIESVNYTSQILYPVVAVGCFIACIWVKQIRIDHIVKGILLLYFIDQIVLGRIAQHNFNSEERSMTAAEAYYLVIPLIYFLNTFLLQGRVRYFYYFMVIAAMIVLCFHRTIWMTSAAALILNWYLVRRHSQVSTYNFLVRLSPIIISAILLIIPLLYVKPELIDNITSSLGDIQNSNKQGTGGWRSEQREIYMALVPEHPFLGWTYEGYDRGEMMSSDATEEWTNAKGTFIHSAYVYTLYNFGIVGILMQFGFIIMVMLKVYKIFDRQDPGQWALFIFISSVLVYSWSYQIPEFYWSFVGIGIYLVYHADKVAKWLHHSTSRQQPIVEPELV